MSDFDKLKKVEIELFKKNPVWIAFLKELKGRKESIKSELEYGMSYSGEKAEELTMNGIKVRQGELGTIRWFEQVFDIQLERLDTINKNEEEKNDED